jgi:hypothetical protein
MKPSRFLAASAALLALCASPAFAHDDAYLATQKAPNGGQLRMAGPYHYELVAGDSASTNAAGRLLVYVTDHAGAPMPTQGAQGVAHVLAGKERASVPLAPDGANRMKGSGHYAWTGDAKVVVSITMPGAQPAQARFTAEPAGATQTMHSSKAAHAH